VAGAATRCAEPIAKSKYFSTNHATLGDRFDDRFRESEVPEIVIYGSLDPSQRVKRNFHGMKNLPCSLARPLDAVPDPGLLF